MRVPEETGSIAWEDAAVGQAAIEPELHVARALELFEDDLVHLGPRFDQSRCEDGEAAAAFDVAGGAEEALGRIEGGRIDAAREDAPARRLREVVGARQTGERIEQDHHIGTVFDEALRALDHELGNRDVVLAGHIERRRNDLASDGSLHIGYFLGALVDEQAHEVHFGVVGRNGSRDILEDRSLARLRGRDR